jgi:iron-sulfur cluster assembly protein
MITLTDRAATKVRDMLSRRGSGIGIMLGVRTTGCSGMAYKLEYVDQPPQGPEFINYTCHGVNIWVDIKSLSYIDGMKMDWVKQGLNEGFDFINPREAARCGCGESFTV